MRVSIVRSLLILSVASTWVMASPCVRAAEPPASSDAATRIADLNEAGAKHYEDRHYRLAIEKFIEAYAIDHDPNLLFNIARCYEELGEVDAAIEKYESFLDSKGADAEGRLRAQASLRSLRTLRAESADDAGRDTAAKDEPATPAAPKTQPPTEAAGSFGILPWAALGGGAVFAGAGTVLYLLGARDHDRITSAPGFGEPSSVHPMTRAEADALVESGDTKKLLGGLGLGLGGALLGTSVALFLAGGESHKGGDGEPTVALDTGKDHVTATFHGRF